MYSILSICIIIPEMINSVQTILFTSFHIYLMFLLMLEMIKMKHKNYQKKRYSKAIFVE